MKRERENNKSNERPVDGECCKKNSIERKSIFIFSKIEVFVGALG
jgi:hypothetical protein